MPDFKRSRVRFASRLGLAALAMGLMAGLFLAGRWLLPGVTDRLAHSGQPVGTLSNLLRMASSGLVLLPFLAAWLAACAKKSIVEQVGEASQPQPPSSPRWPNWGWALSVFIPAALVWGVILAGDPRFLRHGPGRAALAAGPPAQSRRLRRTARGAATGHPGFVPLLPHLAGLHPGTTGLCRI
jgi:hypothetical protein